LRNVELVKDRAQFGTGHLSPSNREPRQHAAHLRSLLGLVRLGNLHPARPIAAGTFGRIWRYRPRLDVAGRYNLTPAVASGANFFRHDHLFLPANVPILAGGEVPSKIAPGGQPRGDVRMPRNGHSGTEFGLSLARLATRMEVKMGARPVKAVSRRRRGPQARLYRACHPAILGHRGRRLANISSAGCLKTGPQYRRCCRS
jgi:hypothetical protein